MRGQGAPPSWALTLRLAEAWHVPPWIVEDEASAEWVERYLILNEEREEQKKK